MSENYNGRGYKYKCKFCKKIDFISRKLAIAHFKEEHFDEIFETNNNFKYEV